MDVNRMLSISNYMKEVFEKWEIILNNDFGKNIVYDRNVLNEILDDFRNSIPDISTFHSNCNDCKLKQLYIEFKEIPF